MLGRLGAYLDADAAHGVGMENPNFDERYPAMFQSGGGGHEADLPDPEQLIPVH
ncbi:hypothetical protein AAGW05_06285 [Arthrobacter sp. LAPM80]|uniref:hypothetical protein n=1 Tax=Arthrobacter sp. LAPM80 TaxID=3141788 RepID=UPI00398AC262